MTKPPSAPPLNSGWFVDGSIDGAVTRRNSSEAVIGSTDAGATFGASDLGFGQADAFDVRARAGYGPISVEGRYLGDFNWKSQTTAATGGRLTIKFADPVSFNGATQASAFDHSRLDSRELNLRFQAAAWFAPFIGYREIRTSDQTIFNITTLRSSSAETAGLSAPWKAAGFQVGAVARLFGPETPWLSTPLFADVDVRAGYFDATGTVNSWLGASGVLYTDQSTVNRSDIPIYELGATIGYRVTSNLELRAGYRYLAIADAMFANDNFARSNAITGASFVPATRRLDLQMATIGFQLMLPPN